MKKITRAIIPVAGWGTRRLPIGKAIEKCMLPVGNRPIVDYVVEDCLRAGITDIYFVVSRQSANLRAYYAPAPELESYLEAQGKAALIPSITPPADATFHFIEQPADGRYGTTIPVAIAAESIPAGESVAVLMGDDFIYSADGTSEVARLIDAAGDSSALMGVEVPLEDVSCYGVIEADVNNNFVRIVEKPTPEQAPSTLINVSKYILNADALQRIREHSQSEQEGEYQIVDPLNQYVTRGGVMKVVTAQGAYLDGGTLEAWVAANDYVVNIATK